MVDEIQKTPEDTGVGDAARSKVPLSHRLGFWNNSFILWGWVLVLSSFLVGGMVGKVFPLQMSMPIIFFGTLCNAIIGILIGAAAARTGYSSAHLPVRPGRRCHFINLSRWRTGLSRCHLL